MCVHMCARAYARVRIEEVHWPPPMSAWTPGRRDGAFAHSNHLRIRTLRNQFAQV